MTIIEIFALATLGLSLGLAARAFAVWQDAKAAKAKEGDTP